METFAVKSGEPSATVLGASARDPQPSSPGYLSGPSWPWRGSWESLSGNGALVHERLPERAPAPVLSEQGPPGPSALLLGVGMSMAGLLPE